MGMFFSDLFGGGGVKPWVSGATYAAGKVAMSPADNYQLYVRVVAGAGTTDPSADTTNWKPFGARAIKSIQRGSVAPPGLQGATAVVTVAAVDMNKSILYLSPTSSYEGTTQALGLAGGGLTSSTQITIKQSAANGGETFDSLGLVYWQLVEYY